MSRQQLLLIPGMEPKRVDMILAGAILLEECLFGLGGSQLKTTTYSLRDGILTREIQQIGNQDHFSVGFDLKELNQKILRFGSSEANVRQTTQLASTLFEKTQSTHRLHSEWKPYLIAASLLRRIGVAISPIHFETHSYYIVKNADFSAMDPWQSEFLAQLCLKQNSHKLSKKDLAFTSDKTRRQAFAKIAALLSLIEALDQKPHLAKVAKSLTRGNRLHLFLVSKNVTELEILRLEQRKNLFESVFQKTLLIKRI
jgi:exopolyphosphatase/guanosine-5'-triphosphate,3'-diphosphate pyrophosphatase